MIEIELYSFFHRRTNFSLLLFLKFVFTGLLDDEDASALLSQAMTDIVPDFINNKAEWITNTISPLATDVINGMLEGMTVDDLLDLLLGGGETTTLAGV